ncbi:MAG TPA: PEP-CTERM sorting domain-containing protein [Lacipirellulaceae bacterium]|jgi:hypothetical protein|nr:PEP-CTERM sorting domain-containing protein [Lacipirellulaceae bacterium]
MNTNLRPTYFSISLFSRAALIFSPAIVLLASASISFASDTLAYSFENDLQGFAGNGGGITVTQDTIGATDGTHSMRIDEVGGQTFAGALTNSLDPAIVGDPPGLDHVTFDMTITQQFGVPNPTPPPDYTGFARIGVTIFGVTQPDFPGGQVAVSAQLENRGVTEIPIDGRAPGTYRDLRIDLTQLSDPFSTTGGIKSFNDLFGTIGSGPNDIIPTGFQFYFNKTGGAAFPLTVYIDNIRFGTTPAGVPGDYNGNGVVDMADYVLWRNGGPLQNEIADVGTVSDADYTAWRNAFGNTSGSGSVLGSAAVPEPTSMVLLCVAIGAIVAGKRTRLAV